MFLPSMSDQETSCDLWLSHEAQHQDIEKILQTSREEKGFSLTFQDSQYAGNWQQHLWTPVFHGSLERIDGNLLFPSFLMSVSLTFWGE